MKVEKFDRPAVKMIKAELQATLDLFKEEYGITMTVGGISFNDKSMSIKVTAETEGKVEADNVMVPYWAKALGLPGDIIGKQYKSKGHTFTVVGIDPKKPKYPINLERDDGKLFRTSVAYMRLKLDI